MMDTDTKLPDDSYSKTLSRKRESGGTLMADYLKTADVWTVLDLIVAEFTSDPMSAQCFDRRLVERAKELSRATRHEVDAGPALLAACRHALITLEVIAENWPEQTGIVHTFQGDVEELRAAIAKAKAEGLS
jgi:hypothetical protein